MAKRTKKITICKDFFYDYIGDLETEQLEFIKEHLDLKTMKIEEDRLQEFYNMLCSDGQETLKAELSGTFEFKRRGSVVFDDVNTIGYEHLTGDFENQELIRVSFDADESAELGAITFDPELIKVNVTPDGKGRLVITAEYV